ncbi:unnamed protein product, partial [Allacma fusca]
SSQKSSKLLNKRDNDDSNDSFGNGSGGDDSRGRDRRRK